MKLRLPFQMPENPRLAFGPPAVAIAVVAGAFLGLEQRDEARLLSAVVDPVALERLPACEKEILEVKLRDRARTSDFRPLTGYDVDRAVLSCQDKQRAAEQAAALVRATKQ